MGNKSYVIGGLVAAAFLTIFILMPTAASDSSAHASPAIPAMLLQTIGEAENQCRIARESCEIDSNSCKANERYENQRTDQCRANIVRKYENCERRRLNTLAPLRGQYGARPSATQVQQYQQRAVIQACGRSPSRGELQKSCPARGGGCYSRGYCTQQYQRCSSNAFLQDQSNNQRQSPEPLRPPQQTETYVPAPQNRKAPRKQSKSWRSKYSYRVTNTCTSPVRAVFARTGRNRNSGITVWGWHTISARADMIVELNSYDLKDFYAYVDNGKIQGWKKKSDIYLSDKPEFRWLFHPGQAPRDFDIKSGKLRKMPFTFIGNREYIDRNTYPSVPEIKIKNCKKKR
ncbi:hypothetical protein SAMN02745824_1367 [Parasphingorhabdus marina DSM 22363]|uniref:Uncharacterized protein n=1 Tax=Parasphingorhabdus marina DSM 22363 TaxID=1123272 RepID=A0A1N6D0C3_9SPHN|nr:hypothetical protein [Parasphingorhabdus marina]SIN64260.1 hypothetical protein SAMN02745824_1367 [Parasphingorhabdus marina DSM 22363]